MGPAATRAPSQSCGASVQSAHPPPNNLWPCLLTAGCSALNRAARGQHPSGLPNASIWRRGAVEAQRFHNPQAGGSSPPAATNMPVRCCKPHTLFVPGERRGGAGRRLQKNFSAWPCRLTARMPVFHTGNAGSTPAGAARSSCGVAWPTSRYRKAVSAGSNPASSTITRA